MIEMKHEPTYVIASIDVDLGRSISRYSTWTDKDDAKQALRAQLSNLAIQFANDHSLDGINRFIDHFYFELPTEPPTDYAREAEEDAAMLITDYFMDEIIDQIIDMGEASRDINNDYDNGDGIFHEVITDRPYGLEEAAELLSQLYRYEEEDSGLWEGVDDLDRIAEIKAAYTYGNAVYDEFDTLIMNINSLDIDYIKFETAIECLEHEPEDTIDYEIIEKAEETRPEYEEKLKERLTKEIKSFCE
jgi:hypothetical protein